jgi:hypothetical protein
MIIIPREEPVVQNLNSYFLKIESMVEHYQGEIGTGGIYFKSSVAEAVIFFDEDNLLNSHYQDKKERLAGTAALTKIIATSSINNFSVSVYQIKPERVYFWANLADAEPLYGNLDSEFTDLAALIQKLEGEKLTGYIDVKLNQDAGGGLVFFFNGEVIGGSSAKGEGHLDRSAAYRDDMIARSRKVGGIFNVNRIQLNNISSMQMPAQTPKPVTPEKNDPAAGAAKAYRYTGKTPLPKPVKQATGPTGSTSPPQQSVSPTPAAVDSKRILEMLQMLLSLLERVVKSNRKLKVDFETYLNKTFMEKADKYEFLDPFAGEFRYTNGQIFFSGKAGYEELVRAIIECVKEIVVSLGIIGIFGKYLESWRKGFSNEIMDFDIEI